MRLTQWEIDNMVEAIETAEFGPEIEIEIVEDSSEASLLLGHIQGADDGIDYVGYEPYEPNPYDGTYSEM